MAEIDVVGGVLCLLTAPFEIPCAVAYYVGPVEWQVNTCSVVGLVAEVRSIHL